MWLSGPCDQTDGVRRLTDPRLGPPPSPPCHTHTPLAWLQLPHPALWNQYHLMKRVPVNKPHSNISWRGVNEWRVRVKTLVVYLDIMAGRRCSSTQLLTFPPSAFWRTTRLAVIYVLSEIYWKTILARELFHLYLLNEVRTVSQTVGF